MENPSNSFTGSSKALLTPAAELAALAVAELLHYDATATKNATGFGGIWWGKMVEIPWECREIPWISYENDGKSPFFLWKWWEHVGKTYFLDENVGDF